MSRCTRIPLSAESSAHGTHCLQTAVHTEPTVCRQQCTRNPLSADSSAHGTHFLQTAVHMRRLPRLTSIPTAGGRLLLKCDGTRVETKFRFSAKWKSPFKSAGGRQFSRLLAAEVCASAVVMLDTPCSEVV